MVARRRVKAYVGIGGNVGGVEAVRARIDEACRLMARISGVESVRRSSVWKSRPVGPIQKQARFINAVAEVIVRGEPRAFLSELQDIEQRLGRDRSKEQPMGPRTMDLDLLLWGDRVVEDKGPPALSVPHPRLHMRAFALAPLCELSGEELVVPGKGGGRVGELLHSALADPAQAVAKL